MRRLPGPTMLIEKQVQDAFKPYGHKIVSIHRFKDPQKAVREAKAIAVGGGNTWLW